MQFLFRPCVFEMDHKAYVNFLIAHHNELNLPYPFAMKLSFLSSPLIYGKALLVFEQDCYELVGAAGFVYGTGDNDYEDRQTAQVEVVYLSKPYRTGKLFFELMRNLIRLMQEEEPQVTRVQFWAMPRDPAHVRLFGKFLALPGSSSETAENGLKLHQAEYSELEAYILRYSSAYAG